MTSHNGKYLVRSVTTSQEKLTNIKMVFILSYVDFGIYPRIVAT